MKAELPCCVLDGFGLLAYLATHVKAQHPISYADAFVVALAQEMQAVVLTGDPEFRKVEHLVTVKWLPQT